MSYLCAGFLRNGYMKKTILLLLLALCSITCHAQLEDGDILDYLLYDAMIGVSSSSDDDFEKELANAKKGDAKAMYKVYEMYVDGTGVEKNYTEGINWLKKSANKGYSAAQFILGNCYNNGHLGVRKSYPEANKWFRKAMAQGSYCATVELAGNYYEGYGVAKSYAESFRLYNQAMTKGFNKDEKDEKLDDNAYGNKGIAEFCIARSYLRGNGVAKSETKAFEYFKKSYELDYEEAACMYCLCLERGIGTAKDISKAVDITIDEAMEESFYEGVFYKWISGDDHPDKEFFTLLYQRLYDKSEAARKLYKLSLSDVKDLMIKFGYGDPTPASKPSTTTATTSTSRPNTTTTTGTGATGSYNTGTSGSYKPSYTSYRPYRSHQFNTPDWEKRPIGLSIGYVQKQWVYKPRKEYLTEYGDITEKYGFYGDDNESKVAQGLQAGIRIEPQFGYGFGLNTGIFYEFYTDKSNDYYDNDGYEYYMTWQEHSLYVPLHLEFRANFSDAFQLFIYGGASIDYGISSKYYGHFYYDDYETEPEDAYGDDMNRFNASWEVGAGIRIKGVQLQWQMSRGLIDMAGKNAEYTVKQNKPMAITLSWMF